MKLTKEERHTLYILMQAELENELTWCTSDGYCYMLCNLFSFEDRNRGYEYIIEELLPELQSKKPKKMYNESVGLWFKSNKSPQARRKRIELLQQCIEETY